MQARRPAHRPRPRGARARADAARRSCPTPEVVPRDLRQVRDAQLLLERTGCRRPPTVLPGEEPPSLPGDGQAAPGLGRALDPPGRRPRRETEFFVGYVDEPVMVQRLMDGPEFSIDILVRPRRPLPERDPAHDDRVARRRVDQGHGHRRPGADRARPRRRRGARRCAARARCRRSATRSIGLGHHRRQHALRRRLPGADVRRARRPHLPRADRPDGPRRAVEPHVGEFRAGHDVHALLLAARARRRHDARRAATSSARRARRRRADPSRSVPSLTA